MPLLDVTACDAIRSAIDAALDESDLPDTTILRDLYIGEGQRMVARRIPDAEARTGDELAQLRTAAILYTAALLCPVAPLYASEMVGHRGYQYQRAPRDPRQLARDLRARAARLVSDVVGATTAGPGLAIARGGR